MRRALGGLRLWTATVLVNSLIMTFYLWHITVMVIVIALAYMAGGFGLGFEPGTAEWWWTRPIWIGILLLLLVPVALPLSVFERMGRSADAATPSAARQIAGALLLCLGLAMLAMFGYGGAPLPKVPVGSMELDVGSFLLVIIGAALSGLLPSLPRRSAGT